jgi:restriction system protein
LNFVLMVVIKLWGWSKPDSLIQPFDNRMTKLPHRNDLMPATVDAVRALGGSASNEEILSKIIELLQIPDELASLPYVTKRGNADSRTQLAYDLAWSRTYLKQLGVLENSARGVWILTGKPLSQANVQKELESAKVTEAPDWRERVSKQLQETLSPAAFERLVQRILRETGFDQVEVLGRTGDGGIDGRGVAKINGILSFRVVFQCKRYKGSVGAPEVRNFQAAVHGRADKGLLITTGYFTRDAIKEATRDGALAIDLVDGEKLAEKLKQLGLGVLVESIETVSVDEEWFKTI